MNSGVVNLLSYELACIRCPVQHEADLILNRTLDVLRSEPKSVPEGSDVVIDPYQNGAVLILVRSLTKRL